MPVQKGDVASYLLDGVFYRCRPKLAQEGFHFLEFLLLYSQEGEGTIGQCSECLFELAHGSSQAEQVDKGQVMLQAFSLFPAYAGFL